MDNRTFRLPAALGAALALAIVCMGTVFADDLGNGQDRDLKLLKASEKGHVAEVRRMLDLGAPIGCSDDEYSGAPLHWSAYKGHLETVHVLLNRGADIHARNKDGRTPLILAAAMNQIPVVKLLLERGADAGITGNDGRSAADWAARKRRVKVIQILNTPLVKNDEIGTPPSLTRVHVGPPQTGPGRPKSVHAPDPAMTLNRALIHAAQRGDVRASVRLLDQGADPNATDARSGRTALIWACSKGREDLVKALLDKGADVNAVDTSQGLSPLMAASERGIPSMVNLLIEKGANINAIDSSGRNALMLACRKGNPKVIGMLLDADADSNAKDASGRTALQWAALSGRKDVKGLVLARQSAGAREGGTQTKADAAAPGPGAEAKSLPGPPSEMSLASPDKNKALLEAADKGDLNQVTNLIAAGGDVKATDKVGATPLIVASAAGHTDVVRFLLEQGSDPNAATTDTMLLQTAVPAGMTSLILATFNGNMDIAQLLLDKGAAVNATNHAGATALLMAVESEQREIADLLLKKGADVNAKSKTGLTALDLATRIGAAEMRDLLLKHGAVALAVPTKADSEDSAPGTPGQSPLQKPAEPPQPAASAGSKSEDKNNDLTEAAAAGNVEELTRLIDQGGDVNARSSAGATLLMVAAGNGKLAAVTLLVDKGAELNAKDKSGKTALTYAVEKQQQEVTKFLRSRGATGSEVPQVAGQKPPTDAPEGKHRMGATSPAPPK